MLPNMDHPEAFGQHPNADITSQIQETRMMFETLLSMQPQTASGVGESREEKVRANISLAGLTGWSCWEGGGVCMAGWSVCVVAAIRFPLSSNSTDTVSCCDLT